jgi:TolA-binding protein
MDAAESIRYKWALLPFVQGDHAIALDRFQSFIKDFSHGQYYYQACFKIATILYFDQSFKTAAEYYAIAAENDSLAFDALTNQMISAKKGAQWATAIEAGKKLIPMTSAGEMPGLLYDIGYAYLRSGRFRPAIEYLKQSVHAKAEPASIYWLAEAYFGRGDFIHGLYYYRRITDLFPNDEMWAPTAYYKTGLVLEFMDEAEEAVKVYEMIIGKRGIQDSWSLEAQRRLDDLR